MRTLSLIENYLYFALHWLIAKLVIFIIVAAGYFFLAVNYRLAIENGQLFNDMSWLEFFTASLVLLLYIRFRYYCKHADITGLARTIRWGIYLTVAGFITCIILKALDELNVLDKELSAATELLIASIYCVVLYFSAPRVLFFQHENKKTEETSKQQDPQQKEQEQVTPA